MPHDDDDDDDGKEEGSNPQCPICMHETSELVQGPCRHEFCISCIERLLLSPVSMGSSNGVSSSSFVTPTLGSCPICRQELYLFDLRYSLTGEKVHKQAVENGTGGFPPELAGSIFVESTEHFPGMIGRGSYHFPLNVQEAPYYDISKVPRRNNNKKNIQTIPFSSCHWHEASRTFAGMLRFQPSDLLSHHHVIFSFSPDWRFVRQGVVIMRRMRDYETTRDIQLAYPFDGSWTVVHSVGTILESAFPINKVFTVQGFGILESITHYPCMIRPSAKDEESSRNKIVFMATMKEFVSSPSCDLDIHNETIPIGYEWTWVDSANPQVSMTWKRETIGTTIPPDHANPLGGNSGRLLLRSTENQDDPFLSAHRPRVKPVYNPNHIWGNVFCQGLKVGLASYHFEGTGDGDDEEEGIHDTNIYISYESPSTGMWPPLDNGQAVPSQVPFRNKSFDRESRTFRGHICWQEDYGTSWQGMIRWEYEMVFDKDYICIVAGQVNSVDLHNVEDCMSRFGESLIYCNANLWQVFRNESMMSSSSNEAAENDTERYRARSAALRVELQRQGASVRTVALVHNILTAAQDPQGQNPVEFID